MSSALKGIKVVDVSQFVAGPAAAQHLGDFGAEVIHVEAPLTGDPWRGFLNGSAAAGGTWAPPSEINYPFEIFNRNKRSLSLDLSQEDGQAVLHRLLEEADVFLTSLRPSQQERFHVDYAALHERYPKLVHGSVTGAGKNGPERDLPAFDATAYWFRSGVHHAFSEPGTGGMTGWRPVFGDSATGMSLFAGIMTALYTRERTGVGQQVDLSLFSMGVYQLSFDVAGCLATGTDFREMALTQDPAGCLRRRRMTQPRERKTAAAPTIIQTTAALNPPAARSESDEPEAGANPRELRPVSVTSSSGLAGPGLMAPVGSATTVKRVKWSVSAVSVTEPSGFVAAWTPSSAAQRTPFQKAMLRLSGS